MLKMSNVPIGKFLPLFAKYGLKVSFLVPTITGYEKSIMDATIPFREMLKDLGIHDYSVQGQGPANKVVIKAFFMEAGGLKETAASLYRPLTKQGDPRVWFYNLKKYCNPFDLLAVLVNKGCLYVVNLSRAEIEQSLYSGFLYDVIHQFVNDDNEIARELLAKLKMIHNKGFLRSITTGDPGVGDTLENALGISRNPSKLPDYKGIELKASRTATTKKRKVSNRVNLFTQVPDWENSRGMDRVKLLNTYGYWTKHDGKDRFDLCCTLQAHVPNPQGLYLKVEEDKGLLVNYYYAAEEYLEKYVAQWSLSLLKNRLLEKHPETFWVKATSDFVDGVEYFRYDKVIHTKNPNASLFPQLIDDGIITVDYLMHRRDNGGVRDHGFPFKIHPNHLNLLFPEEIVYDL